MDQSQGLLYPGQDIGEAASQTGGRLLILTRSVARNNKKDGTITKILQCNIRQASYFFLYFGYFRGGYYCRLKSYKKGCIFLLIEVFFDVESDLKSIFVARPHFWSYRRKKP